MHLVDSRVIAQIAIVAEGSNDLAFKRYSDGDVMLTQGDDRVYLTVKQFDLLKQFMSGAT